MTNKELIEIANMELRDQLEAERVKVKKLEEKLKIDNEDIGTLLTDNKKFMELADKYKGLLKECQLLLFDNGFTFDKEDRKKCVDLLARLSEAL